MLYKIFESDWKYSAKVAAIIYLFAFILFPVFLPFFVAKALLPTIQFFAKFICLICVLISVIKLFFDKNKPKPLVFESPDFERVEPSISSSNSRTPYKEKQQNAPFSEYSKDEDIKPDWLVSESPNVAYRSQRNVKEQWTLEFINSLDWKVFETLCSQYFGAIGVKNKETTLGADGGIDLVLYENNDNKPSAIVQCKKWSNQIGIKLLREFSGVMHHQKITKGHFFTTSNFHRTAIVFAEENNIELVDGPTLIKLLKGLETEKQEKIFELITAGDYTTPTCVRCGKKMVIRTNKKTREEFWGCNTYRCMSTLNIKSKPKKNSKLISTVTLRF